VLTTQSEHPDVAGAFLQFLHEGHETDEPTWHDRYMIVTGVLGWTHDFADLDDPFVTDDQIVPFIEAMEHSRNRPLVSGYEEFRQLSFNAAIQGRRQPGSAFKPVVYSTALESGKRPCDYQRNALSVYKDYEDWTPRNVRHEYGGRNSL
jgi:hypothetical protein